MGSTHNHWPFIINLGNSIIGVALLAMPYCFQQCGIVLSMVVLILCTWLTLISCQLLMKAGVTCRRRSYEFLAYYTHGARGKFVSEIGMIGFQLGTLIAQIVVIGDLGPSIASKIFGIENSSRLRTYLMVVLCMTVGLPMALIRDIRSISKVSAVCVAFYSIFVVYVCWLALPNLISGDWYQKVYFWRPAGFFQNLPILSFSFGCQAQLFLLYDALPEPSLKVMSKVVSSAVNLCAVGYLLVGFFGYVAFYSHDIPGDVIGVFPNALATDLMKICFVFSIVITFPVMVFPCRASIYTLLYSKFSQDILFCKIFMLILFVHYDVYLQFIQEDSLHQGEDVLDDEKSKVRDDVIDLDTYIPPKQLRIITFSLVVGSMVIAILIPNVEFILGMNGAIMGTLICYIFPALFFLKVMGNKQEGKNLAQLVLILGITILLVSTYSTLRSQDKGGTHVDKQALTTPIPVAADMDLLMPKDLVVGNANLPDVNGVNKNGGDLSNSAVVGDVRKEPPNPHPPDIAKPAEDVKPGEKNVIKRELNDDRVKETKEVAGANIDRLVEANKAKELELQEKEKKQGELLEALEKQNREQKMLIEEQKQLLKEFKDHHDKDIQQGLRQQVVAQNQQDLVGQPIVPPQTRVNQQQIGQETMMQQQQQQQLQENQNSVQTQQLPQPQVNGTGRLDSGNQQQVVMPIIPQQGDQVNFEDPLTRENKSEGHVDKVGFNVNPADELLSVNQKSKREAHLAPERGQSVFQQKVEFVAQKEQHEIKQQQQQDQLVQKEEILPGIRQHLQPDLQEKQKLVYQPELKSQFVSQQLQISEQEQQQQQQQQQQQLQVMQQKQSQQPPIQQQEQNPDQNHLQPEISQQEQKPESMQKNPPTLPQQTLQSNKKLSSVIVPDKAPELEDFSRQKRDSLVNQTDISQVKGNQNDFHKETLQQNGELEATTKKHEPGLKQNGHIKTTEIVSENPSNDDMAQGVISDIQKPRDNEEMKRKLMSLG